MLAKKSIPHRSFKRNVAQKPSKNARFGAKMSQISNFCVGIKLKESRFSLALKSGFIYAMRIALIASRNFLQCF